MCHMEWIPVSWITRLSGYCLAGPSLTPAKVPEAQSALVDTG